MSGINQAKQANETYKAKFGSGGGSGFLKLRDGDIVRCYFPGSGDDGDPYFETYVAHEIPPESADKNRQYWYCPALSDHPVPAGYQCKWCGVPKIKTKRRMYMWFYVQAIMHKTLLQGENFPQVNYKGINFFQEEVNDFKRWDTSAWDESPFEDIVMIKMQFGALNTQRTLLSVVGSQLKRRYKMAGEPNTPALPDAYQAKAKEDCQPIMAILQSKLQQDSDAEPVIRSLDDTPNMGLPNVGQPATPGFGDPNGGFAQNANGFANPAPPPQPGFAASPAPAGLPPKGEPLF